LMESIDALKLLQSQEFISDAEKLLAEAGEEDLADEPQSAGQTECNPCYNSSLHPNNNWAVPKIKSVPINSYQGYGKTTPDWAKAQARITNDAGVEARNGALKSVKKVFAQEGSEEMAEEGCNPCYNSSLHKNNNWGPVPKVAKTLPYNGYEAIPGPPVWAKA